MKKDEDQDPIAYLFDRATVLQETRLFNETPLNARKCRNLIARVLGILYQGETLVTREATDLFFATTKLFQNRDPALRQIVYLLVKELATSAEDVMMATSSLTKDINSKAEDLFSGAGPLGGISSFKFGGGGAAATAASALQALSNATQNQQPGQGSIIGTAVNHRANAVRALCKVTDAALLQAIERFIKQMILDKNAAVASAALVSSYHYHLVAKDTVRRWANEVQEALGAKELSSKSMGSTAAAFSAFGVVYQGSITQYHALALLYRMRQNDRMAVAKMLQNLSQGNDVKFPWALCMLVRFAAKFIEDERGQYPPGTDIVKTQEGSLSAQLYEFLKTMLSNRSEMVAVEAARAMCGLVSYSPEDNGLTNFQVIPAITALKLFLSSTKPALRFASLRTLNQLAMTHSDLVSACNLDMEDLITDQNRSIATFAITTLLKTGNDSSVDRLMKQITPFMSEISDEFKIIVIESIRSLALKFPRKHEATLNFLSGVLRDEGGYEYKKSIVEALFDLIKNVPESKEAALGHLCEFIEDCEFNKLAVRVLYLLGREGPSTSNPRKYIRYIYNRLILENSPVRAAAVTALAQFAGKLGMDVKQSVKVLLARCLDDYDDEVRDRATVYLKIVDEQALSQALITRESLFNVSVLENRLAEYTKDKSSWSKPVDVSTVPNVSRETEERKRIHGKALDSQLTAGMGTNVGVLSGRGGSGVAGSDQDQTKKGDAPGQIAVSAEEQQSNYLDEISKVPQLARLNSQHVKSSVKPVELTERELEYIVDCIKHVFQDWVVFQFKVKNTLNDMVLDDVSVEMNPEDPDLNTVLEPAILVPAERIDYEAEESIYVAFRKAPGAAPVGSYSTSLKYKTLDRDPVSGDIIGDEGYEDEYGLEDLEIVIADYVVESHVSNFDGLWEELGEDNETVEGYQLSSITSLSAAVPKVQELLGMKAIMGSDIFDSSSPRHTMYLSGLYCGNLKALARCRLLIMDGQGLALEVAARCEDAEAAEALANAFE